LAMKYTKRRLSGPTAHLAAIGPMIMQEIIGWLGDPTQQAPSPAGGSVIKCPSPLSVIKGSYEHSCD
jgi:hypothetical protein